jgi:hypothetical protein
VTSERLEVYVLGVLSKSSGMALTPLLGVHNISAEVDKDHLETVCSIIVPGNSSIPSVFFM